RTLSTSDDVEDRENEKGRLEEAYEKCDRELDELIVQHYTELTTAIRTYQSITERITNSRNKIKQVKENLLSCKMLLHCKRDELRKLWIEGIEHKHVLNLLDEIENIKQVPQKLEQCMASKRYLNATDMLLDATLMPWPVEPHLVFVVAVTSSCLLSLCHHLPFVFLFLLLCQPCCSHRVMEWFELEGT
ncbi:hypothetical protein Nmel_005046, partial [Mimus melanotis]